MDEFKVVYRVPSQDRTNWVRCVLLPFYDHASAETAVVNLARCQELRGAQIIRMGHYDEDRKLEE